MDSVSSHLSNTLVATDSSSVATEADISRKEQAQVDNVSVIRQIAAAFRRDKTTTVPSSFAVPNSKDNIGGAGSIRIQASITRQDSMESETTTDAMTASTKGELVRPESASSIDSSVSRISELSENDFISVKTQQSTLEKSPQEIRCRTMLADNPRIAKLDKEYTAMYEPWKKATSKLTKQAYSNVASERLGALIQELSLQAGSSFEKEFLAPNHEIENHEELKKLYDFTKLYESASTSVFDQALREPYRQACTAFKNALHRYLACKGIVELKLPEAFPQEFELLYHAIEQEKSHLDHTVDALKTMRQTVLEKNQQAIDALLRKACPGASTLEAAFDELSSRPTS